MVYSIIPANPNGTPNPNGTHHRIEIRFSPTDRHAYHVYTLHGTLAEAQQDAIQWLASEDQEPQRELHR